MSRRRPLTIALAAAMSVMAAIPAAAQEVRHTPAGAPWITGGAGQDERDAMKAQASQYNLMLTFANRRSGAFRADVALQVHDARGGIVLSAQGVGPLLYARLEPGTYRVTAKALGRAQSQQAVVPQEGMRELYFYWVDPTETEPGGTRAGQ